MASSLSEGPESGTWGKGSGLGGDSTAVCSHGIYEVEAVSAILLPEVYLTKSTHCHKHKTSPPSSLQLYWPTVISR